MADPRNDEKVGLTVLFRESDLEEFEKAAEAYSVKEHGDFSKTDIIRMGARRFAADILAAAATPAV